MIENALRFISLSDANVRFVLFGSLLIGAHGEPIPNKKGEITQRHFPRLTELANGISATVRRVSDHNPEMLRYINKLGLSLGTLVRVDSRAPFNGPLSLLVNKAINCSISIEVAKNIFAEPIKQ